MTVAEFPQEWRDAALAAICDTPAPDGWSGGDEHNRARAIAVLAALSEVGALREPVDEDLSLPSQGKAVRRVHIIPGEVPEEVRNVQ